MRRGPSVAGWAYPFDAINGPTNSPTSARDLTSRPGTLIVLCQREPYYFVVVASNDMGIRVGRV